MKMCTMHSPIGMLKILSDDMGISQICFEEGEVIEPSDLLQKETVKQLNEYFAGKRKTFNLHLSMQGTDFQKKVWKALMEIPYGQTVSYQEIAVKAGSPKAVRAVGGANHVNPIPIVVPCHRVIHKDGSLGGYGGGVDKKKYLLELERSK